ncbi:MAG: glycoside hydrolase family 140 protein, partial [Limisphaerales bacterium]
RAMAGGLRAGDGGIHLMTFHPPGGNGSSQWFHGEEWLDFNMRQNGHVTEFNARYSQTKADYDKAPTKPVIDAEPIYEDHPISFNAKEFGHSIAADVRRPLYWNLFSGAFGHTYGHHSVWQMYSEGKTPINAPLMPWHEAIDQPGAAQMQFGRKLIESRPFLTRVPDDNVIVTGKVATSIPGAGQKRLVATRDLAGTYAMIYTPVGRKFSVNMDVIKGGKVKAWWFNPRTGKAEAIGQFENKGTREFNPPNPGEMLDWVLVLDDAQKDYPAPGSKSLL